MARPRRALALALLLALAGPSLPARAQSLRTLHVDALSMRADKNRVPVGDTFHLAIHARVRERITALDELVVPDVGTMHLLGDERHVTNGPNGTDVVETLTLEPTVPGAVTFAGAYVDAVDAATKKPSRFSTNPVRVVVTERGGPAVVPSGFWRRLLVTALVGLLLVMTLGLLGFAIVQRRRRLAPVAPVAPVVTPVAPPPPPRTPRDDVADALRAYRGAPADGALARLRGALFAAAGTTPGATLRDALRSTPDTPLRAALSAAERAAFGPAHARDGATQALVDATEAWLR